MMEFFRLKTLGYFPAFLSFTIAGFAGEKSQSEFFESKVRPLLVEKCQSCHGATKQQASLRLDSSTGVFSGGENGPAVVVGQVDDSLLIKAVRRDGLEMPPDEPLSDSEVAILEKWVREGSYWPKVSEAMKAVALGDQEAIHRHAKEHWSFQPIAKPTVPIVSSDSDIRNPIDAFIISKLESSGLKPIEAAERRTLLRRVSFDVTGLPPAIKDVEDFEKSEDPQAFMKLVDGLLNSKQFGPRWGRYWLDIARYADTRDWQAQTDERYPFAYTFRDYVIRAINEDKPYDVFLREQLAADLLTKDPHSPSLAALGFLTVGPRFRNNGLEQMSDRIDAVTRGMMGMTVACARCHDHKYDPIKIDDYYALYSVFDSTELTDDLPTLNSGRRIEPDDIAAYEKAKAEKIQAMEDYIAKLRSDSIDVVAAEPQKYFKAFYETSVTKTIPIRGAVSKYKVDDTAMTAFEASLERIIRNKAFAKHPVLGPLVEGFAISEKEFKAKSEAFVDSQSKQDKNRNTIVLKALGDKSPKSRLELLEVYASIFSELKKWGDAPDSDGLEIKKAFFESTGILDLSRASVIAGYRLAGAGRKKLGDLESAIREVDAVHPGSPPRAMIVTEKDSPVNAFVMLRGEPSRRGERVSRRFISFLDHDHPEPFVQGSGRLELANKITDPSNPLTARVAVNRVWIRCFGVGLVASADDFGLRCDAPLHRELLDWLAASFIENQWSMKWLLRTIMESAAYQRSSIAPDSSHAIASDSENSLLWKQNRKRLDFEATRDTMLAVSGELDRSLDGPSVKLNQTPYSFRRSVYAYVDRVDMDPVLKTFDFASPLASTSSRSETTVPQHALFVMNHPFVIERAKTIAVKVRPTDQSKEAFARGVNSLFRRMLGRNPTPQERTSALSFINAPISAEGLRRSSPWSYGVMKPGSENPNEFIELAYWSGEAYQAGPEFPDSKLGHSRLTSVGGHPGSPQMDVVRRFTVPASGIANITGRLKHLRDSGDGVLASVVVRSNGYSGPNEVGRWRSLNNQVDTPVKEIHVLAGNTIDFIISAGKTSSSDAHNWTVEIEMHFDGESSTKWSSREGFKPPPPALMDGWEQLAQALMLTNEFIYID